MPLEAIAPLCIKQHLDTLGPFPVCSPVLGKERTWLAQAGVTCRAGSG